jgi:hypothetical protein
MTISKTSPSELTGQSLTDTKIKVWSLGLRLWMWKNQPQLRIRQSYPEHELVNIEFEDIKNYAIRYNKVYCVPVWTVDMDKIAYYYLFTNEGYWLGRITTLRYLESASETKI